MEETALLTACALNLPTSGSVPDQEGKVYYWLGAANEKLAQQLFVAGADIREHHYTVQIRRQTQTDR